MWKSLHSYIVLYRIFEMRLTPHWYDFHWLSKRDDKTKSIWIIPKILQVFSASRGSNSRNFLASKRLEWHFHKILDQIIVFLPFCRCLPNLHLHLFDFNSSNYSIYRCLHSIYWQTHAIQTFIFPPPKIKTQELGAGFVRRFCFNCCAVQEIRTFRIKCNYVFQFDRLRLAHTHTITRTHLFNRQHETWANFYLSFFTSYSCAHYRPPNACVMCEWACALFRGTFKWCVF